MPPRRLTYLQIADDLEVRMRQGEYPAGSQMPSYSQLADMYSCGISTAQAAIRMLRARGLLESLPGVGTFVIDPLPDR